MPRRQGDDDKTPDEAADESGAAPAEATPAAPEGRGTRRTGDGRSETARPQHADPPPPPDARAPVTVVESSQQFMVAAIPGAELFRTMDVGMLGTTIAEIPGVEFVRSVQPTGMAAMQTADMPPVPAIHVYRMAPQRAAAIADRSRSQLLVEPDEAVTVGGTAVRTPFGADVRDPGVLFPMAADKAFTCTIEVRGDDRPVPGASVFVYGSVFPVQGVTGADGRVTVTLLNDTADTIRGVIVKPASGYWSRSITRPRLDPAGVNRIAVRPLAETHPDLAARELLGWGQRMMRLDQIPADYRGQGVRIAIIDSGSATTHPDLAELRLGRDVQSDRAEAWNEDGIGHGSHCAGIICGSSRNGTGVRGFAPDAEVHTVKVFPRGHFSDIAAALDHCMAQEVDVINLSLGSDAGSDILAQRFVKAKSLGIACIVAAGNSGGPVLFPARMPEVLAVSAMGLWGEFPEDSHHASQSADRTRTSGPFSAAFTCFGPEIGVVGPGVAILSSVPPDGFAAMDGTSMAAPHVTGLAALVLAHHPAFKTTHAARNAARVDMLFRILKESAQPMDFGDRNRTGAGLPDAVRALQAPARVGGMAGTTLPDAGDGDTIRRLIEAMIEAALAGRAPPGVQMPPRGAAAPASTQAAATAFGGARPLSAGFPPPPQPPAEHPLLQFLRNLR